jgi:hypothetical protein
MPFKDPEAAKAYNAKRYQERRAEFIEAEKARYHGNKEAIRLRRLELAYRHRAINAARERQRYADLRQSVIAHYGGGCSCCGETEPLFLEIDHVNNDGHLHRQEIGRTAKALLVWIVKNDFPDTFQILCANCNQGKKRNGGICPHQSKSDP